MALFDDFGTHPSVQIVLLNPFSNLYIPSIILNPFDVTYVKYSLYCFERSLEKIIRYLVILFFTILFILIQVVVPASLLPPRPPSSYCEFSAWYQEVENYHTDIFIVFYYVNYFRPRRPHEIVEKAILKIGEIGYNVLWKNCEHFAAYCRYGVDWSEQVSTVLKFGIWLM